jgi:uncharacterized damage-inducible protein DinB
LTKPYRKGFIGALMDEYERAAGELIAIIEGLSDEEYEIVRDTQTLDEDLRSIQGILSHVVRAGYGHAGMLRNTWGLERIRWNETVPRGDARSRVAEMLAYTSATFNGKWDISEDEAEAMRIQSGWGTVYDLEQLLEHAVVHMLRHRRQIERFLGR